MKNLINRAKMATKFNLNVFGDISKTARKRLVNGSKTTRNCLVNVSSIKWLKVATLFLVLTIGVGSVLGADLTISLSFSTNVFSLSTSSSNDASTEISKTADGYTYKLYATTSCYYYGTKALLIGKKDSYIVFPAITGKKLTKVSITNNKGAGAPDVSICPTNSTTATTGGEAKTVTAEATTEWTLTATTAGTEYRAYTTNAKNMQITAWELEYTNASGTSYTVV